MKYLLSRFCLLTLSFVFFYGCKSQEAKTNSTDDGVAIEIPTSEQQPEFRSDESTNPPPFVMPEITEVSSDAEEEALDLPVGNASAPKKVAKPSKKTWKRSNKTINTATLFIGDKEQLPAKGAQIAIKVDGFRARVLLDFFFYSDQNRMLEGTFKMRLPQGASPYYFAFGESVYLNQKDKSSLPFVAQQTANLSADRIEEVRAASWSQPKVARVVEKEKAAFAYHQTVSRQIDPALA